MLVVVDVWLYVATKTKFLLLH